MIVDLVDKLIDRCIQLINFRKEQRKTLFENSIKPIFSQFEIVHKEYLQSFKRYRDLLNNSDEDLKRIIDLIETDNLFSEDQRAKLRALADGTGNSSLDRFVQYIHMYLMSPEHPESLVELCKDRKYMHHPYLSQRWRTGLLRELRKSGELINRKKNGFDPYHAPWKTDLRRELRKSGIKGERTEAIVILDSLVRQMQELYGFVVHRYTAIQNELTKQI